MIGVIVDGPGDFASVRARFTHDVRVVKTDGPRGHTVEPRVIAATASKQIRLLHAWGCARAILLVDYEERVTPYAEFLDGLRKELAARTHPIPVIAAAPNRMIENWYLADVEAMSKKAFIRSGLRQKKYEGTHGKEVLKGLMAHGYSYNEVKHGPPLFQCIRERVACANSASFSEFLKLLSS